MSGGVPLYGYVALACLFALVILALFVGRWTGYDRGWSACEEEREQARARRVHPVYRVRPPQLEQIAAGEVAHEQQRPTRAEVIRSLEARGYSFEATAEDQAHEAWLAHTEQALSLASASGPHRPGVAAEESCSGLAAAEPDPRTDSQWTADQTADLRAFMDGLLSAHPATEEL